MNEYVYVCGIVLKGVPSDTDDAEMHRRFMEVAVDKQRNRVPPARPRGDRGVPSCEVDAC